MHPILFEAGGLTVYTYGVLLAAAYLLGLQFALVRGRSRGLHPQRGINLARSAGVFYGGLIAAVAVALLYLRRHHMPLWTTTDCFAPGIALGHVIGRMGCLLAGCCYGRPTDVPWAITFRNPLA